MNKQELIIQVKQTVRYVIHGSTGPFVATLKIWCMFNAAAFTHPVMLDSVARTVKPEIDWVEIDDDYELDYGLHEHVPKTEEKL